jgi:hypothetical protein
MSVVHVDLRGSGLSTGQPTDLSFDGLAATSRSFEWRTSASTGRASWGTRSSACSRSWVSVSHLHGITGLEELEPSLYRRLAKGQ